MFPNVFSLSRTVSRQCSQRPRCRWATTVRSISHHQSPLDSPIIARPNNHQERPLQLISRSTSFHDASGGHHPVGPSVVKGLYRRLVREARELDKALIACADSPMALLELKHIIKTISPALPEEMETSLLVRGANVLYWSGRPLHGQVEVAVKNIFRRSVSEEYLSTIDWNNTDHVTYSRDWFGRGTSALRSISSARVLLHSNKICNNRSWQDLIQEYEKSAFRVPIEMGALLMMRGLSSHGDDEAAVAAQLDEITQQVRWRLESDMAVSAQDTKVNESRSSNRQSLVEFQEELNVLAAMNDVLFGEQDDGSFGLRGTMGAKLPPEHSLIDSVLSRRQGLPATLALIYISVGQRLGVPIEPVALPTLVVVKPRSWGAHPLYADKFINVIAKGEVVTRAWCQTVVSECSSSSTSEKDSFFAPVHPLSLHARILSNLIVGSKQSGKLNESQSTINPSQANALAWLDQLVVLMDQAPPVQDLEPEQMA